MFYLFVCIFFWGGDTGKGQKVIFLKDINLSEISLVTRRAMRAPLSLKGPGRRE